MHMHAFRTISLALALAAGALAGCGRTTASHSEVDEAWDQRNRPEIFGLRTMLYDELAQSTATRGIMNNRPWRDSYWPFYKKNLAWRFQEDGWREWHSFDSQVSDARNAPWNAMLSPAEKYDILVGDQGFTVTRDSWNTYNYYSNAYPNEPGKWAWMGICSGWAPASVTEPVPKSHVAANMGGRQVLFYTGDLRGLMGKVYDINQMTDYTRMIGSRCDSATANVPRDAHGRPVDGRMTVTGRNLSFITDNSHDYGVMEVRYDDGATGWLMADARISRLHGSVQLWPYASREDVMADLIDAARGRRASGPKTEVWFYKACRDTNPASLHLTLVQQLSDVAKEKKSFIAEINRGHEVWNHPVVAFTSKMESPRPIAEDDPQRRAFRAPGTTHVVDVRTYLVYVPGWGAPRVDGGHDDGLAIDLDNINSVAGRFGVSTLNYSLEFDRNGVLIGGEWIESASNDALDFFWKPTGVPTDTHRNGHPSMLKYSLIKKLFDCSQRAPDTTVTQPSANGGELSIPAVSCPL